MKGVGGPRKVQAEQRRPLVDAHKLLKTFILFSVFLRFRLLKGFGRSAFGGLGLQDGLFGALRSSGSAKRQFLASALSHWHHRASRQRDNETEGHDVRVVICKE